MPHYAILYPVRHDGVRYEPPAVLELDETEAAALLATAVLKPAAVPPPEPPQTGVLALTAEIVAQVFADQGVRKDKQPTLAHAIKILGKNTDAGTTDDGIRLVIDPKTLTQTMLDEAWGMYTAAQGES